MRALASLSLLVAGCGAASVAPPSAAPPRPAPSLCIVRGTAPEVRLTVDALSFPLELTGRARYVLSPSSEVSVHAEGPLELSAHTTFEAVPLSLGMPLEAPVFDASAGTALADVEFVAGRLVATLLLDLEVRVRTPLGCPHLALGAGAGCSSSRSDAATHELVGDTPLPIAARPDGAPLALVLAPSGSLWRVVEQEGGRMRVVRRLERGALDGWVDAGRLRALAGPRGRGYATGSSRCGGVSVRIGRSASPGLIYEGPAHLRPGAVLRGAGGAGFARARAPIEVRVRLVLGAEPAVLFVDGLTSRGSTELPGGVTVRLGELDLPRGALP